MTIDFSDWCSEEEEEIGEHDLHLLTALDDELETGLGNIAAAIPDHYISPERIAGLFERLGKEAVAAYLREKLPKAPRPRSADLAEILATEYIDDVTDFFVPIKRLRWKDHREMAMRGDDVIGFWLSEEKDEIEFLKSEVKSRQNLAAGVVAEAREALDGYNGLPAPHALEFVSDRLHAAGQIGLSDLIDKALLKDGISPDKVSHLLFTFSGNKPDNFLKGDLNSYDGDIYQISVGLKVTDHQNFIAAAFDGVEADDDT